VPHSADEARGGKDALSEITIAYGMTETGPVSCQSTIDTPLDKRVSTVGTVHDHLEWKIIDASTGETVPPGVQGEILHAWLFRDAWPTGTMR